MRNFAFSGLLAASLAPMAAAQCGTQWVPEVGTPGTNGVVRATCNWDPDGAGPQPTLLVVGGDFTVAGGIVVDHIATFDHATNAWSAVGGGLNGAARCLAVLANGDLVVGGDFTIAGGVLVNRVARWDGVTWHALANGVDQAVHALVPLPAGGLVAGGEFVTAGGTPAARIARWDGSAWTPLGGGLDDACAAVTLMANGDVVAGGSFLNAGGVPMARIARWDGAGWNAMSAGMSDRVDCLATLSNGDVLAGGLFPSAGVPGTRCVARWNGAAWTSVGGGFAYGYRVLAAHALPNGEFVVGGQFTFVGGVSVDSVARWNGTAWVPLGGASSSAVPIVRAILPLANGEFVIGGESLSSPNPGPRSFVLRSNGITAWGGWLSLGSGFDIMPNPIAVLPDGDLLAYGSASTGANGRVLRRHGGAWSEVGTCPIIPSGMIVAANGDIVVGGYGLNGGICRWNGIAWQVVPGSSSFAASAMTETATGAIVSSFWFGAAAVRSFAAGAWTQLGPTFDGGVAALTSLPNGDVVAGGSFTHAGAVVCLRVARWNGSTWSPLGAGFSGNVHALVTMPNGDVVAGGWFQYEWAGSVMVNGIARWNGTTWQPFGAGMNGTVEALAILPNGDLVAGGQFTYAGGVAANKVARWNGTGWVSLGPASPIFAVLRLAAASNGDIACAGLLATGPGYLADVRPTCPAVVASQGTGCIGSGGLGTLTASTTPWIGSTFRARGTNMPALGLVASIYGFTSVAVPLASILPIGGAGCDLLAAPDIVVGLVPVAGVAPSEIALPSAGSLVGLTFHHQMVPIELDASFAPIALTATNALALTIGTY